MPKAWVALLMILGLMLGDGVGCSRPGEPDASGKNENITVAVTSWPASATLFVADEKGFFRDEGLEATLQANLSGHLGLDAVLSGRADLATAGETPVARAAMDGKPLVILATICKIDQAILIIARKDRGISAPEDLRGKKIGVIAGTTADFFLHIYLATSYVDPKEVQLKNIDTDKVVEALLNAEVDAVSTWSPHTIVLRDQLGSQALVLYDPSIYTMTWNIVATQDFVQKNPQRINKFLRALVRANRWIAEYPAEMRSISAARMGTQSSLFEREWQNYRFDVELDQGLILNLEDQARWMNRKGAGEAGGYPNFLDFIDAGGLKTIQPDAVSIVGK
jgi:ABC-type nitrate/sulfonate/bicarbonate transport system substrate-binding protein